MSDLDPCQKQRVVATIITEDGRRFTGTNGVRNPQPVCPREEAGDPRGHGYDKCRDICGQPGHAERMALEAAFAADACTIGGVLYLEGHDQVGGPDSTYPGRHVCPDCQARLDAAGIARIIIGAPPAQLDALQVAQDKAAHHQRVAAGYRRKGIIRMADHHQRIATRHMREADQLRRKQRGITT